MILHLQAVARKKASESSLLSFTPLANGDDGNRASNGVISADQVVVKETNQGDTTHIGLVRFPLITVAQGATISLAELKLYLTSGTGTDTITPGVNTTDNASFPSSGADYSGRTWSSGTGVAMPGSTGQYVTWDVTSLVQAIVNRGGWVSGNSMLFRFIRGGTTNNLYTFANFEGGVNLPTLEITP